MLLYNVVLGEVYNSYRRGLLALSVSSFTGNARASMRGTDNNGSRFFCVRIIHLAAQSWAAKDFTGMSVSTDVVIPGKDNPIPSTGLASDALPEVHQSASLPVSAQKGVSTKNTLFPKTINNDCLTIKEHCESSPLTPHHSPLTVPASPPSLNAHPSTLNDKHWYALRTTYGREQLAYEYMNSHGAMVYWPTMEQIKEVDGKRRKVRVSRIPNILFAHGTLLQVQRFVYDNANLPFLRFYYAKETIGREIVRRPLIVPERQMESLRIICAVDDGNIAIVPQSDSHFAKGQQVRITQGRFAGVTGRVARYQGQQRVAVVIDGLITIATAYIPTAFLAPIND